MEPMTEIGNVNLLDMRKATEASVASIKQIGNINLVLYTRETAGLIIRLNSGNINEMVELPTDVDVLQSTGENIINKDRFKGLTAPQFLLMIGQTIIEPDVMIEDVEKGLARLICVGQVAYPDHLTSVIQSRSRIIGQVRIYPAFAHTHFKSITLDEKYLNSLPDGSDVAVVGGVKAPQVLPSDLLARKIRKLFVAEELTCHEENAQALQARLTKGSGEVVIIPAGFALVEKPLQLDSATLEFLPARKLYCTERVIIAADVDTGTLDKHLDAIQNREAIISPLALKSTLAKKCNLFDTRVIFYEGELMLIDDSRHLKVARFSNMQGKGTLVVTGELKIDPAVTPQMIAEHVAKVHNLGRIVCTPEQMAVIESLLGLREGELADSTEVKEKEPPVEHKGFIGNINKLEL